MPAGVGKSISIIGGTFDGGGAAPAANSKFFFVARFAGIIVAWDIVADQVGDAVIDVWKRAGAIPTVANSISPTEKPTLAAQQLNSDTQLTTWTTFQVSPGDVFGFNLDSVLTVTRVTVEIAIAQR